MPFQETLIGSCEMTSLVTARTSPALKGKSLFILQQYFVMTFRPVSYI